MVGDSLILRLSAVLFVCLLPTLVFAQQPQRVPVEDRMLATIIEAQGSLKGALDGPYRMLQAVVQDEQEAVATIRALRQHQADLDAYLRRCGDKPGCTVPIQKTVK